MERYCDLNEISDGRLYDSEDFVKADSNGCEGCSTCCRIVGESILLDPYDIYEMTTHLGVTVHQLLVDKLELHVIDGLIMPNIKTDHAKGGCGFLNEEGRCSIHSFRPGFCRMFPLGRCYENNNFRYIIQIHECPHQHKKEVRVREWLGIPDLKRYEQYICDWHYLILDLQHAIKAGLEDVLIKQINMYLLQNFYLNSYNHNEDFYLQFYKRYTKAKQEIIL